MALDENILAVVCYVWCNILPALCNSCILYSRWSDVERLPFPLVTPVVKLAESMDGTAGREYSFKNPIFLIGLIIPFLISTTNILHEYIPVVPEVKTYFSVHEQITSGILGQSFAEWPGTLFIVHPYTVGIGYLVPTDFTFSIWFSFYVLQRMVLFPVLLSAEFLLEATGILR